MTVHDWFAGLLSTGQWLTIFIVLGIVLGIGLVIVMASAGEDEAHLGFVAGMIIPISLWLLIMAVLHFVSFLIGLWNWDYVPGEQPSWVN